MYGTVFTAPKFCRRKPHLWDACEKALFIFISSGPSTLNQFGIFEVIVFPLAAFVLLRHLSHKNSRIIKAITITIQGSSGVLQKQNDCEGKI